MIVSCSTWVTSPLSIYIFFSSAVFSLWGENMWLPCLVLQRLTGCLGAVHEKQCWAVNRLMLSRATYTWQHRQRRQTSAALWTSPPLMDVPHATKAHYQRADSYLAASVPVLAPAMSLSPQRGAPWCLRIAAHNLIELIQGGAGADLEGDNRFLWLCFCASERKKKRCCLSHDTGIQAAVNGDR